MKSTIVMKIAGGGIGTRLSLGANYEITIKGVLTGAEINDINAEMRLEKCDIVTKSKYD